MALTPSNSVIPAKAGIQGLKFRHLPWMPAFAGMTVGRIGGEGTRENLS
jgi:hypothetical protein